MIIRKDLVPISNIHVPLFCNGYHPMKAPGRLLVLQVPNLLVVVTPLSMYKFGYLKTYVKRHFFVIRNQIIHAVEWDIRKSGVYLGLRRRSILLRSS